MGENKALETKKKSFFFRVNARSFVPQAPWQPSVWHCNQIEKDLKSFFLIFVFVVEGFFSSRISWFFSFIFSSYSLKLMFFFKSRPWSLHINQCWWCLKFILNSFFFQNDLFFSSKSSGNYPKIRYTLPFRLLWHPNSSPCCHGQQVHLKLKYF